MVITKSNNKCFGAQSAKGWTESLILMLLCKKTKMDCESYNPLNFRHVLKPIHATPKMMYEKNCLTICYELREEQKNCGGKNKKAGTSQLFRQIVVELGGIEPPTSTMPL